MVKFVKKRKSNVNNTSVKKFSPKAKDKPPRLRKTWKPKKGVVATHPLKVEEVTSSVNALLQVIKKKKEENKKSLFKDDSQEIMLQVQAVKVPDTRKLQLRATLPYSLAKESSDLCFITTDVKTSTKDDHEPTIAHYKELLEKENITNKIEIVPIRQLRSECVTYEAKGRFANLYDLYLVDGRLLGKVTKMVGSRFFRKHNMLIPVKVNTSKFKTEMEKALATTSMLVHGNGDSYMVQVGYSHFRIEELVANICSVATMLANRFPGGFTNIRRLLIKSKFSMAIPVYISLTPANEVPVPVVLPHLPKAYKPVEGELTTVLGGHVKVYPSGKVDFKRVFTKEDEEMGVVRRRNQNLHSKFRLEDSDDDDSLDGADDESDMEEEPSAVMGNKHSVENEEMGSDEDDEDDEDVETAEDVYMKELQDRPKEQPFERKTNVKGKKQAKVLTKLDKKKGGLRTPAIAKPGPAEGPSKRKRKRKQKLGASSLSSPAAGTSKKVVTPGGERTETPNKGPLNKKKQKKKGNSSGSETANSQVKVIGKNVMKKSFTPEAKKMVTLNKTPSNKKLKNGLTAVIKETEFPNKTPANDMLKKGLTPGSKKMVTPNKLPATKMQKNSVTPSSKKTETPNKTASKMMKKDLTPESKKMGTPNKTPASKMQKSTVTPGSKEVQTPNKTPGMKMFKKSDTSENKSDKTPNKMQSSNRKTKLKASTPSNIMMDSPQKADNTPGSKKLRKSMNTNTSDSQSTPMFTAKDTPVGGFGSVKGKHPVSRQSLGRLTPKNPMKFIEESVPVTGKSPKDKIQLKKARVSFVPSEKEVGPIAPSPQQAGKRRESSSVTPRPKKMKGDKGLDISAEHRYIPVNGEVHSAKKNKANVKNQKSAKKRKSAISDNGESGDGSFVRYFSKENQKT